MLLLQSQEMREKVRFYSCPIKTKWEFNLQVLLSEVIKEVIELSRQTAVANPKPKHVLIKKQVLIMHEL